MTYSPERRGFNHSPLSPLGSIQAGKNPAAKIFAPVGYAKTPFSGDALIGAPVTFDQETVSSLGTKLRDGPTTAMEVADTARRKAAAAGPVFITITDDDGQAEESHTRLQSHTPRSVLEGVPVAVKDVFDTARVPTTMGSKLFADYVPDKDARLVTQLRAAGANIVGKTNTHEFSYGIRGDSSAFGVVPNPHDETRIAGGSSSGSAAAVAQGIVPVALGSDTAGSIRVPAALCGAVGFKPTFDLLDPTGIFPLAPSFDTAGFISTAVFDIVLTLDAIGVHGFAGLSDNIDNLSFRTLRGNPGLADDIPAEETEQRIPDVFDAPDVDHPSFDGRPANFRAAYNTIRSREAYLVHERYLRDESSAELYQPLTYSRLLEGTDVTDREVQATRRTIAEISQRYLDEFSDTDILLSTTVPIEAPPRNQEPGTSSEQLVSQCVAWNVLGWPALTVPYWSANDPLPKAVQVIGKPGRDADVLRAGRHIEHTLAQQAKTLDDA